MKTIILDVDGVLNTMRLEPPTNIWKDWVSHEVTDRSKDKKFQVDIAQDVIDFLIEIDYRDDVEILWHTTWQDGANDISEIFSFPKFPVLPCPEFTSWNHRRAEGWWKLPAVKRFLDTCDHDVLWIDDDLAVILPKPVHGNGFTLKLMAPNQYTGLTPQHLKQIRTFLDGGDE